MDIRVNDIVIVSKHIEITCNLKNDKCQIISINHRDNEFAVLATRKGVIEQVRIIVHANHIVRNLSQEDREKILHEQIIDLQRKMHQQPLQIVKTKPVKTDHQKLAEKIFIARMKDVVDPKANDIKRSASIAIDAAKSFLLQLNRASEISNQANAPDTTHDK